MDGCMGYVCECFFFFVNRVMSVNVNKREWDILLIFVFVGLEILYFVEISDQVETIPEFRIRIVSRNQYLILANLDVSPTFYLTRLTTNKIKRYQHTINAFPRSVPNLHHYDKRQSGHVHSTFSDQIHVLYQHDTITTTSCI